MVTRADGDVQRQAGELLEQNQQLLEYIGELVSCLSEAKSISLNHLASPAPGRVCNIITRHVFVMSVCFVR